MTIEPDSPPEFRQLRLAAAPFAFQQPVYGWGEPEEIVRSDQEYSLIFVVDVDHTKVLLGMKRRGMGVGLYNGFGGKRDPGETMLQCAARELYEESGISANEDALYHKGTLYTSRPLKGGAKGMRKQMIKISVFACFSWTGVPIETEEMTPQWFDIDKLPTQRMWPEASMYLRPVMGSIMRGHTDEGFYARVDYELLAPSDAPTTLPALDGLSVRTREVSTDDDVAERLSGWFMALTSE